MPELIECMPYPNESLPVYLKEIISFGDEIIKGNSHTMDTACISIINDFNFALRRLWTYAIINDKGVCWIDFDHNEDMYQFHACKMEGGKEYTSDLWIPNNLDAEMISNLILPMLAERCNSVYDKNMLNIFIKVQAMLDGL